MKAARTPTPVLDLHHRVGLRNFALDNRGLRRNGSSLHRRPKQSRACDRNRNDVFLHFNRPYLNAPFLGTLSIWYAKKKSSPRDHDNFFRKSGEFRHRSTVTSPEFLLDALASDMLFFFFRNINDMSVATARALLGTAQNKTRGQARSSTAGHQIAMRLFTLQSMHQFGRGSP
ncbi:hypothetical protein [Rhodomicrobium udaipurense]|uniref:Uncharacterized protein n=1 Tax=Rhodomicrobium udaipurense TaxID=1202716 RepID=A0A8I1GBH4_9HYPH|nr:hypothetical protein [Rhodomicrobium udaipurense]MBJ7542715.1 hypothetical protein [Rhodomicrobium udaipurense]